MRYERLAFLELETFTHLLISFVNGGIKVARTVSKNREQ